MATMKVWAKAAVTITLLGVIGLIVPWHELWRHAQKLDPDVWLGVFGMI